MGLQFRIGYTAAIFSFLPFAIKRAAENYDSEFNLFYGKNAMVGAFTGISLSLMTLFPLNRQIGFMFMPLSVGATVIGAAQGLAYTAILRASLKRHQASKPPVYEEFRL